MRIAVASEGNKVSGHFGHCEGFTIFDVDNGNIVSKEDVKNPGHKPGFLPEFLKGKNVDVIISGGMGEKAQDLFKNNNIDVVVGAEGLADDEVKRFISGSLKSTGSVCSKHEYEGHCNE